MNLFLVRVCLFLCARPSREVGLRGCSRSPYLREVFRVFRPRSGPGTHMRGLLSSCSIKNFPFVRATSTTNVNLSDSSSGMRGASECQETADLSRKRATSAHSLNRKPDGKNRTKNYLLVEKLIQVDPNLKATYMQGCYILSD